MFEVNLIIKIIYSLNFKLDIFEKYPALLSHKTGQCLYFKYIVFKLNKSNKIINRFLSLSKSFNIIITDELYNEFIESFDLTMKQIYDIKYKFNNSEIFNDWQKEKLNNILKNYSKKITKLRAEIVKIHFKNESKVEDPDLIHLLSNYNNMQLKKYLAKRY